jgi:hypothetical protein
MRMALPVTFGYADETYAQSFAELGQPVRLEESDGWIIRRAIQDEPFFDAMGCYPLFSCLNWDNLHKDLDNLTGIISLSLVTDPFGSYTADYLRSCFPDRMDLFKQHFIVDLEGDYEARFSAHHRRNALKASDSLQVEECADPRLRISEWSALYSNLIKRHEIRGLANFSYEAFEKHLTVPGVQLHRAVYEGETVGMVIWYLSQSRGYYHLAAYNETGYKLKASFALFWFAFHRFANLNIRYLTLGAGAGLTGNTDDGLSRFKRGWSTETRPVYFCGRIFDHSSYAGLIERRNIPPTNYFPAYRFGEL